jgi:hypothetical protein
MALAPRLIGNVSLELLAADIDFDNDYIGIGSAANAGRTGKCHPSEFLQAVTDLLPSLTHTVEVVYPTAGQTIIPVSGYYPGTGQLSVYLNGVKLVTGVDYTEATTTTITLTTAASLGDVVELNIGSASVVTLGATSKTSQDLTATDGQTDLTVNTYTPGLNQIEVFMNGALLSGSEYTETNATTITLTNPASSTDTFRIIFNQVSTVLTPDPAGMRLTDGVTAPSSVTGLAIIYVDTADGNLKVKFGDGVVNTIATDQVGVTTWAPGDTSPSVSGTGSNFRTANVGLTTITALDDGYEGQEVVVVINDAFTKIDFTGTNLKGNASVDWTPGVGSFMRCTRVASVWYCTVTNV